MVNATLRPLYARESDPVPIIWESRWASGSVWRGAESYRPHQNSFPEPSSPQRVAVPTELSQPIKCVKLKAKLYLWRSWCGGRAPFILDLGTWRKWMVSLKLRPLNSLGGPQSFYWRCAEVKDLMPLSVTKPRFLAPWTCSLAATPTDLSLIRSVHKPYIKKIFRNPRLLYRPSSMPGITKNLGKLSIQMD